MDIDTSELEEFISATISSVLSAVDATGSRVQNHIKFDLAVTNTKEGETGLKIYVVNAGGKISSETSSRITFDINPNHKRDVEEVKRQNDDLSKQINFDPFE